MHLSEPISTDLPALLIREFVTASLSMASLRDFHARLSQHSYFHRFYLLSSILWFYVLSSFYTLESSRKWV